MEDQKLFAQRVRELFDYSPDTGAFLRRVRTSKSVQAGTVAGSVRRDGYRVIRVDGVLYLAHRLAWVYAYGVWPSHKIDHKDGDPDNNRFANLRDVSDRVNAQNKRVAQSNNASGFLGVVMRRGKPEGQIRVEGKAHRLGVHKTPAEAHLTYLKAKRKLHPGCTI